MPFACCKVLSDGRALHDWIHTLGHTGLIILTGVPRDLTSMLQLAQRVAFLKKTNYG